MAAVDGEQPDPLGWRFKLLDWTLVCAIALATFAFPVIAVQAQILSNLLWTLVMVALYLLLLAARFIRRLSFTVRALCLLTGLGAVAMLGFLRVGFQVGPGIGSALIVVLAGLLLGRVGMVSTFVLSLGGIISVGAYQVNTHAAFVAPGINDPALFPNWIRVGVVYALYTGVLSAAVSFVVSHIEALLEQRTDTLKRLQAAQLLKQEAEHARDVAQRTILQMQKMEALGRLAGGVAHDFNNVLVVILGWADLLRHGPNDPAELERGLGEIVSAGNHAAGLTRQLLSFGRRSVLSPRAVEVASLFREVDGMLRRVLPTNIVFTLDAAEGLPPIFADPGQMQQVLINLCVNARDALPNGGELGLRATFVRARMGSDLPPGDWVSIGVRDTGVGMGADTMAHIFEPFFTTKGELGTGLGLSTVYGIVGHSGGHVLVESQLNKGSSFTVLLPPHSAAEKRIERVSAPVVEARASTILVAEDEPAVRHLIVSALRSAGHCVLEAADGPAALEVARCHRGEISLLCTDGVMPGTNSVELIADFRLLYPRANILVCSGHLTPPALDSLSRAGVRFLPKPFTTAALQKSVAQALNAGLDDDGDRPRYS